MSEVQAVPDKPTVRLWRRAAIALGCVIALTAAVGFLITRSEQARATAELRALTDQLDADDPHWRLEEIEARREVIPDDENSAPIITTVAAALPARWVAEEEYAAASPLPNIMLEPRLVELINKELASVGGVLPEARRLADLPRGRYRLTHSFNPMATKVEAQAGRDVSRLLRLDAVHLAQQGDIDGALRSARATINAARASGDEPFFISHVVRCAIIGQAGNMIERALAQGEASEKELAAVQRLLALEEQHPTLRLAARGERALHHDLFEKMLAGKINTDDIRREIGLRQSWWEGLLNDRISRRDHVADLRLMTAYVESTRLPVAEQAAEERRLDAEAKGPTASPVARLLAPAMFTMGEHTRRKTAVVRSLLALVAVERYRLETGRWPESLEHLTPKYLAEVPRDPFDARLIRYTRTTEGVVVYSIGKDGIDSGGVVWPRPAADEGYRLWNVNQRRQPARIKPPAPGGIPP